MFPLRSTGGVIGLSSQHFVHPNLAQLPERDRAIAERLIRGSRETCLDIFFQQQIIATLEKERRSKSSAGRFFYKTQIELLTWKRGLSVVLNRIQQDHERIATLRERPVDPLQEQKPDYVWFGCSDSRFRSEKLIQGPMGTVFPFRNIGGMVTRTGSSEELSPDAKRFIVYAKDNLGVKTAVIATHSKCGCIANAHNPHAKIHVHGHTKEEDVVRSELHESMQHVVAPVMAEGGIEHYLRLAQNPVMDKKDEPLFASEILHCLASHKIIKNYVDQKLTMPGAIPSMDVIAVHFDLLRTSTMYILNRDTGYFVPFEIDVPGRPENKMRVAAERTAATPKR